MWFVKHVTEARRTGVVDKEKDLLVKVFKLFGSSAYGKLIVALKRQTNATYTIDKTVVDQYMKSA